MKNGLQPLIGRKLEVLGGQGFVRLIDIMGDDSAIVQAARVSYGEGTKSVREDESLIRYLIRKRHTSPMEMCEIKLHLRMPLFVARQWVRHRTASLNEVSGRYSVLPSEFLEIPRDEWRTQSSKNKQGSGGLVDEDTGRSLSMRQYEAHNVSRVVYEERLKAGVAREQARVDLPLSTFTEFYWKIDLHNLLHFLALRMDRHAQQEIREYADAIGKQIVARWVPAVWGAFRDYVQDSMTLSYFDTLVIMCLNAGQMKSARKNVENLSKGERSELREKLLKLGFQKYLIDSMDGDD